MVHRQGLLTSQFRYQCSIIRRARNFSANSTSNLSRSAFRPILWLPLCRHSARAWALRKRVITWNQGLRWRRRMQISYPRKNRKAKPVRTHQLWLSKKTLSPTEVLTQGMVTRLVKIRASLRSVGTFSVFVRIPKMAARPIRELPLLGIFQSTALNDRRII